MTWICLHPLVSIISLSSAPCIWMWFSGRIVMWPVPLSDSGPAGREEDAGPDLLTAWSGLAGRHPSRQGQEEEGGWEEKEREEESQKVGGTQQWWRGEVRLLVHSWTQKILSRCLSGLICLLLFHSVAEKARYNTYYCSCVPPNNIAVVEMSLCIIDGHMCKRWMTCLHEMFVYSESRINNWPWINLIVSGKLACTRNCNKVHDLNCSISLSQSVLRKSTNQS